MRTAAAVLLLLMAAPAAAQVQTRATDPPSVTALNESWFQLGEPLELGGELYFRAGATVFFDGNRMARIGHYNGIPLYADTTVEPHSVVLVPVTRGLLQPYERPRRGDLAGTTGSSAPAFPVYPVPQSMPPTAAAAPPTGLPAPIGGVNAFTQTPTAAALPARADAAAGSTLPAEPADARAVASLLRPRNNDGVWIQFEDRKWVSAGPPFRLPTWISCVSAITGASRCSAAAFPVTKLFTSPRVEDSRRRIAHASHSARHSDSSGARGASRRSPS